MKFEAEKKKTILGRVSESFHLVYRFKSPNNTSIHEFHDPISQTILSLVATWTRGKLPF